MRVFVLIKVYCILLHWSLSLYEPEDYDQFSDELISKQIEEVVAGYDYRIKSLEDYKDRLIRDYKCFSDFVSKYREQLESL